MAAHPGLVVDVGERLLLRRRRLLRLCAERSQHACERTTAEPRLRLCERECR